MVAEKLQTDKSDTENNLTISTKLSTDQLICKSPQTSSVEGSVKSLQHVIPLKDSDEDHKRNENETPIALYFGVLQILFGLLMAVFGVLVLVHNSSLSQIGGGLWGGCLATLTGVLGVLSAAKDCCPLKTNPQRIALTAFLALSLISLAVSNLVLVLAAISLARDANRTDEFADDEQEAPINPSLALPANYTALLSSSGLLLISACEVIAAAVSAYHSARTLCPCFKAPGKRECNCRSGSCYAASAAGKDLLVHSWLGKHGSVTPVHGMQPVYVVTTTSSKRKVAPMMYPIPTPPPSMIKAPMLRYPLIPAPLGTTPPPFIHPHYPPEKMHKKRRRYPTDRQLAPQQIAKPQEKPKKHKKKEKQKTITTEEVAKTYTGLDRVIAEEFIEICDSARNTSSSSDTSGCTGSETTSNEFVGEKL